MGNQSQSSTIIENEQYHLQHPKIPNPVYKKIQDRQFIETHFPIENNKQYDDWSESLKDNPVTDSEWAFHPFKHEYQKAGMCGNSGTATAKFDNYSTLLSQQIEEYREKDVRKFSNDQVWYLLYVLTNLSSKFHKKGEKLGDIRPKNIFINEEGKIKVATKYSWPREIPNFEKTFFDKEKSYLSPEEMKEVEIGRAKSNSDPTLAESFSIGLTALDAILLENSEPLYSNETFDKSRFEGKRQNLRNEPGYSDLLKYIVLGLTQPQPESRLSAQELSNWFEPIRNAILERNQFKVNDLPAKVKENVSKNPIVPRMAAKSQASQTQIYMPPNNFALNQEVPIQKVESGLLDEPIQKVESGFVENHEDNRFSATSPINKFTVENSQVREIYSEKRQEPIPTNPEVGVERKEEVVVQEKVRASLEQINEKIANSRKMFPS